MKLPMDFRFEGEGMDRLEYLKFCQECATIPSGTCGVKEKVPDRCKVVFQNVPYYPVSYELSFDSEGKAVHRVVLHDLRANSITRCDLDKVEKFCNINGGNDELKN